MANSRFNDNEYLKFRNLLQRLMQVIHAQASRYALRHKLSLSECKVLFLLSSGKQIEMNRIKNDLFITGAYVTAIVDRLIRHELVVRQRDNRDRRKVTITLTDKGRRCLMRLQVDGNGLFKLLFSKLRKKDKVAMERGILMLLYSLESIKDFNAFRWI